MSDNMMLTMPVKKLMLKTGIPVMCSMALQAVYNIVDSAFVANMEGVGEQALNALTLAFPIQLLMIAIIVGLGIGSSIVMSCSLGQKNQEQANRVAGNAKFICLAAALCFMIFGFFGTEIYIASQTTNSVIAEMGVDYLRICCVFSFGFCLFGIHEKLLQTTGRAMYSTIAQISGAVTNIVLDPILIYGLLGAPALGVKGAAIATVVGQIVACLVAMTCHALHNREIQNNLKYMIPSKPIVAQIFRVGLPPMIAQGMVSVMAYLLNIIFVRIDESVVTVYGLYYKIQQFVMLISFGLRDASTPIVATAFGLQDKQRIKDGIKYSMIIATVIMVAGTVIFEAFANPITQAFGLSGDVYALCVSAIRLITLSFVFAGLNIAIQGVVQALNFGLYSLIISACRQFIFVVPVAYGLTQWVIHNPGNTWVVWTTFLIGEGITCIIAFVLLKKTKMQTIGAL